MDVRERIAGRTIVRSPEQPADARLILSLDRITAGRTQPVLADLSWQVREAELWAVVGPNGAGKSSLLAVLRGQVPITRGELRYGPHPLGRALAADPFGRLRSVSFGAQTDLLKGAAGYSQSRWHGGQDVAVACGKDVLGAALKDTEVQRIVDALRLTPLLERRITELSNGERRKLLLARSAALRPAVLALDNPFAGLDAAARAFVSDAVASLHGDGMTLLISTSREDEIPDAVTHVLILDGGRVVTSGPKDAVLGGERLAHIMQRGTRGVEASSKRAGRGSRVADRDPVVELRNVDLTYGDAAVLRGMTWTVRHGERWVVLGPNGAGKSALLSLILADNPQAYANDVSLFGRRRGTGDTIWEIRRRIGTVSPEMHLYQDRSHTAFDVVASGLQDPLAPVPLTKEQIAAAERCLIALDLERCADRALHALSEGEAQMALLGRALMKRPELLVLDEPCQGLDARRRARFLDVLDHELRSSHTTLIYVTHDLDEIPSTVSHGLLLRQGRSALQGSADEVIRVYTLPEPSL